MDNVQKGTNIKNEANKKRKVLSAKNIKAYLHKDMKRLNAKINSLTTKNINQKNKKILRPSTTFLCKNN